MRTFNFKKQLKVGNIGEKLFLKHYENIGATKGDGVIVDLLIGKQAVELKTDTYPFSKSPNFFMERYGNIKDRADGGPWRSLKHNIDFFVYFYLDETTYYWFKTAKLCKFLDENLHKFTPKEINNRTWASLGFLVPREFCSSVIYKTDKF